MVEHSPRKIWTSETIKKRNGIVLEEAFDPSPDFEKKLLSCPLVSEDVMSAPCVKFKRLALIKF